MKSVLKYIRKIVDINSSFSGITFLAVVVIILIAGLWPFNFFPKNKVKWLQNKNGISFYGQSIVISSGKLQKINKSLFPDISISMELWLRPLDEPGSLPHIVDLHNGASPGVIAVGQWKSHLIIQSRTNDPAQFKRRGKPYRETGLDNALLKNQDIFLTIISDKTGSAVFVNGVPAKSYPGFQLLSEYKDEPINIILGNSPTGQSFWKGEFMGLAIYNKVLTPGQIYANYQYWMGDGYESLKQNAGLVCLYPFNERKESIIHNYADSDCSLIIPEIFKALEKTVLDPPWREEIRSLSFIDDATVNLVGFIPFGFFMAAFLLNNKRSGLNKIYFTVIIAGITLSLFIELTQVFLPTRSSQLSDLILNGFGTAIGVIIEVQGIR